MLMICGLVAVAGTLCIFVSVECAIPVGSLTMIIYDGGKNFRAKDMLKVTIPIILCSIVLAVIWLSVYGRLTGLM